MAKEKITRTYGPIHFEDLEPHRFEDLVRALIHDFKDWQTIEAVGRSGSDGGFDARAYEKNIDDSAVDDEESEDRSTVHPMEGNLWMIQAKREKTIGPTKLKSYLSEVDSKNPPYGYILAASVNFSKKSQDLFREELRKKGVMEFYLWGKGELEGMLYQPKNDHILFTFLGISLVSKRKSRSTEIRRIVANKNKLYRIFGEDFSGCNSVLMRDSKDTKYPYKSDYKDFEKRARWREYDAKEFHPRGLVTNVFKFFAYVDVDKKEYDLADAVNLTHRQSDSDEDRQKKRDIRDRVEDFWEHLPHRNKATFLQDGLVRYDSMLVIDEKGDEWHKFPHIYVDFDGRTGAFSGFWQHLQFGGDGDVVSDYKRVKKFPKSFPKPKRGNFIKTNEVDLEEGVLGISSYGDGRYFVLYDCDGKYDFLKQRDVIPMVNSGDEDINSSRKCLHITNVERLKAKDYLKRGEDLRFRIERQIGRKLKQDEMLNVYEFKVTYEFNYKK